MDISAKKSYAFRQRNLLQDLVRRGTQVSSCSKLPSQIDCITQTRLYHGFANRCMMADQVFGSRFVNPWEIWKGLSISCSPRIFASLMSSPAVAILGNNAWLRVSSLDVPLFQTRPTPFAPADRSCACCQSELSSLLHLIGRYISHRSRWVETTMIPHAMPGMEGRCTGYDEHVPACRPGKWGKFQLGCPRCRIEHRSGGSDRRCLLFEGPRHDHTVGHEDLERAIV